MVKQQVAGLWHVSPTHNHATPDTSQQAWQQHHQFPCLPCWQAWWQAPQPPHVVAGAQEGWEFPTCQVMFGMAYG